MNQGQPQVRGRRRVVRATLPAGLTRGQRFAGSKWGAAPEADALPPPPTHWRREGRCRPEPDRALSLKLLLNKITKPMSRDEVALLIELVGRRSVIGCRETNAATNKLKDEAWNSLTWEFNKKSVQKRSTVQLRIKWENLKKAVRAREKRVYQSKRDSIVASQAERVPLDGILDRVSGLLGYGKTDDQCEDNSIVVDSADETNCSTAQKRKPNVSMDESLVGECEERVESNTGTKNSSSVIERNLAIARYYNKKTEKLQLEIEILKIKLNKQKNNNCDISFISNSQNNINNIIKKLSSEVNSEVLNINNILSKNGICTNDNDSIKNSGDSDSDR